MQYLQSLRKEMEQLRIKELLLLRQQLAHTPLGSKARTTMGGWPTSVAVRVFPPDVMHSHTQAHPIVRPPLRKTLSQTTPKESSRLVARPTLSSLVVK